MKILVEQKVWDYLDGLGSEEERAEIEKLLQSDAEYQTVYKDLSKINHSLSELEMDEPSLSFTRNVMDQLKGEPVPGSIKLLIDKRIINGLFFFFLSSIAILLAVLVFQIDWSTPSEPVSYSVQLPEFNVVSYFNEWIVKGFLFLDMIIALYLFDYFLHKKDKKRKVI
jgi:hypothetical protein